MADLHLSGKIPRKLLVEKGSVCVNGVSLTVAEVEDDTFSVAIIPYTWEHTNLQHLWVGEHVNIEFDIAAGYYNQAIAKYLQGLIEIIHQKFFCLRHQGPAGCLPSGRLGRG